MNKTKHLGLNQWDPTDRILRTDFNGDNAKIDAALAALEGGPDSRVGALESALPGKLGRMEDIFLWESDGMEFSSGGGTSCRFPAIGWDQWEYVCALIHFPNSTAADEQIIQLSLNCSGDRSYKINSLVVPGILLVLLPRHNAGARLAGFAISNRLVPFSFESRFQDLGAVYANITKGPIIQPNVAWFGGK